MKICFVIHGLSMGGAEKFLINLSNYLSETGYHNDIVILSDDNELKNELDKRSRIYELKRESRFDVGIYNRLKKHILEKEYNLIFCINAYSFFITRIALLGNNNVRMILSPHTTKPFSTYKFIQNFIYFRFIRERDKIIYLCKQQKQYLKNIYRYHHNNDKIVYNGVDTNYFNSDKLSKSLIDDLRRDLDIGLSKKVIVQIARISPEKNQIDAIKAIEILHKKHNIMAHLILVGTGNKDIIRSLRVEIHAKSLTAYVHLMGNQRDVRPYYQIANLFTLTSISETFPISSLEAMSFGLPCVLTDVGGVREIIKENEWGHITKVNNPEMIANGWKKLLEKRFEPESIRKYLIDNFSLEKMLKEYGDILLDQIQS